MDLEIRRYDGPGQWYWSLSLRGQYQQVCEILRAHRVRLTCRSLQQGLPGEPRPEILDDIPAFALLQHLPEMAANGHMRHA